MIIVMTSLGLTSSELSQEEGTTRTMTFQAASNPTASTLTSRYDAATVSGNGVFIDLNTNNKRHSKDQSSE